MPIPQLTEIEEAASRLTELLTAHEAGSKTLWQIEGAPSAGKSACLRRTAELLDGTDLIPIRVAPPGYHRDDGPIALADLASGLADKGLLNGDFQRWSTEKSGWVDRVDTVRAWVYEHSDQVVLLCDAPDTWGGANEDDFFSSRGFQAAFSITGLPCRRVVAGGIPVPVSPLHSFKLGRPTVDADWLFDADSWGELGPTAAEVADSPLVDRPLTPLQVRLLVAAVALSSLDRVIAWFQHQKEGDVRGLIARVAEAMQQQSPHRRLWHAWLRLSLTRRDFGDEVLDKLTSADATLLERDVIRHCLLFGDSSFQMHETLKLYAFRWRAENRGDQPARGVVSRANRNLFEVHRQRFQRLRAKKSAFALRESMEAFHFASVIGDPALLEKVKPAFVEQLDALGWSLSYEHHDYAGAAEAFEHALDWDETDDYAHHYLAYNLDRYGRRLEDVESHYRRAIELKPRHAWWWSRLISFLIGRGRIGEARAEWENALLELGLAEGDASLSTYQHLYGWVAGALLDAGEVTFAREVLDDVPLWAQAQMERYADLSQRADALLQLGEGDAVVPARRLRPGWWEFGPELLQHRFAAGQQLVRWLAARVESKDDEGIHVRGAIVERGGEKPSIAWSVIRSDRFDEVCRDNVSAHDLRVGSFLELGLYAPPDGKGKTVTVIRVIPEQSWETAGLPTVRPSRYLSDLDSQR